MGKAKAMKAKAMKAKAMKAMKAKAMKAKAMKAMKVSVIAKGKLAKAVVFAGREAKTQTGLTKDKLVKSKTGKIVSKAKSQAGKKRYASGIGRWTAAVQAAKKALGIKGFVAVGGKSAQGKALHAKAKSLYKA